MHPQLSIRELISELLESQQKVALMLDHGVSEKFDDSRILEFFLKVRNELLFINGAISEKVADYCQLLNGEENCKDVSLDQIKDIYEGLVKIHPLDIGFYESLAFYLNNVLDQPNEAKLILHSGIELIERRIATLKEAAKGFQ